MRTYSAFTQFYRVLRTFMCRQTISRRGGRDFSRNALVRSIAGPIIRKFDAPSIILPMPGKPFRHSDRIPPLVHVVNVVGLVVSALILLFTFINLSYQLLVFVPMVGVAWAYWRQRKNPRVVASYFGMSMALLTWILICEHIVLIDNLLHTRLSERLSLGVRLQTYVLANLRDRVADHESCCADSLTWRYRPGSRYRFAYDCPSCREPYEVIVDEAGYLNQERGLMERHPQIDMFLAGDSVMQGMGVPSILEWARQRVPVTMWNLSIAGYAPRQKVSALLTYAIPKQPRWLVVEFYALNDLSEAIRDDVFAEGCDYRCRYNEPEFHRRLAQHPVYRSIFDLPNGWATLRYYSAHNFTLAMTRHLIEAIKNGIRRRVKPGPPPPSSSTHVVTQPGNDVPSSNGSGEREGHTIWASGLPFPPGGVRVRQGRWDDWLAVGMAATKRQYERLVTTLEGIRPKPSVILLYNPTPYQVYRDVWIDREPESDRSLGSTRAALARFADVHGWQFLDLTEPLRQEVKARQTWLFGRHDITHWSLEGSAIVGDVLARELLTVIRTQAGDK